METLGKPKVENLIFYLHENAYEVLVDEENPQVSYLSFVFELEKKDLTQKEKKDFLTENNVSITEKPEEELMEEILNILSGE